MHPAAVAAGGRRMISVSGLEKRYGRKPVLGSISLEVAPGEFLLVTGPNGSGKSTLLRLLAGLAAPSRGSLAVGADRGQIGYLGHEPLLYRELSALENLDLFGRLYRLSDRAARAQALLRRFGLWDVRGERVASYSRGMVQRLALCRVLLHDPVLLLLDEPYTALDDEGGVVLDRELDLLAGERTLVLSTHDPQSLTGRASQRLQLSR